ncbi:MAG: hypothetical protein HKN63_12265 [Rhodobacteraceae bacterium]|nr:hypothetical protein [Paracoccaceae bacterium]
MLETQMDARNSLRGKAPDYEAFAKKYKDAAKIKGATDPNRVQKDRVLEIDISEKVKSNMLTGSSE